MARRARAAGPPSKEQLGISVVRPNARAVALAAERDRLLREIKRRRKELERTEHDIEAARAAMDAVLSGIVQEQSRVEAEIHARFTELLAPGRLPKRRRSQVRALYVGLQRAGVLGRPGSTLDADPEFHGFDDGEDPLPGENPGTVDPATKHDAEGHDTLRKLFKRLVVALHPDRTRHEGEKRERTEAMKDVTRAYEEGDLARLIELGARFSADPKLAGEGRDAERAEDMLERLVAELKTQLRSLLDELRALRRSEAFRAAKEIERGTARGEDPIGEVAEEERALLDELAGIRDFVASFIAGKIDIEEFLEGPPLPDGAPELEDLDEVLDDFLMEIFGAAEAPAQLKSAKKRQRPHAARRAGSRRPT